MQNAAGLILAVTEQRNWIEVFFEGDLMHTRTVNFPSGCMFDIYIEEILTRRRFTNTRGR